MSSVHADSLQAPLGNVTIASDPTVYYAWPSVARLQSGELLVVTYEGGAHTHSHGKVVLYRSKDEGRTWDEGTVVADTILDDRDPGIVVLNDDTVIVSSRVAWWEGVDADKIDPDEAKQLMAKYSWGYIIKSTDGGRTWSDMIPYPFQPKGPVELSDGALFALGKLTGTSFKAYISKDQGDTWQPLGDISGFPERMTAHGVEYSMGYWEPHFVQTATGRIVAYIRAHSHEPSYGTIDTSFLWIAYSDDLGKTWSKPEMTDILGYPPHALRLHDGRILLSYGYRYSPFGQRARISDDGINFKMYPEIVIRGDAPDPDLGYPGSIQLDERRILTVYYQKNRLSAKPVLMATVWTLD